MQFVEIPMKLVEKVLQSEFVVSTQRFLCVHNKPFGWIKYKIKIIGSESWQFTNYLILRFSNFQHDFIGKLDAESVNGYQI